MWAGWFCCANVSTGMVVDRILRVKGRQGTRQVVRSIGLYQTNRLRGSVALPSSSSPVLTVDTTPAFTLISIPLVCAEMSRFTPSGCRRTLAWTWQFPPLDCGTSRHGESAGLYSDLQALLMLRQSRFDEAGEQGMRRRRLGFELGVILHGQEPRMVGHFDDFG